MDLNHLLFQHQIALMTHAGQIDSPNPLAIDFEHYAQLIADFRHRENITSVLFSGYAKSAGADSGRWL